MMGSTLGSTLGQILTYVPEKTKRISKQGRPYLTVIFGGLFQHSMMINLREIENK